MQGATSWLLERPKTQDQAVEGPGSRDDEADNVRDELDWEGVVVSLAKRDSAK